MPKRSWSMKKDLSDVVNAAVDTNCDVLRLLLLC